MMCVNTINIVNASFIEPKFTSKRYKKLQDIVKKIDYSRNIVKVYPTFSWNTGMGYYFPKLNMELDGLPAPYSTFDVEGEHL